MVRVDGQGCNSVHKGFTWSDNSCAYNLVLTILFSVWISDNPCHEVMTSNLARILQQTFQSITGDQKFKRHHNLFRHALETVDPTSHRFGEIVAVGSFLHCLLATENTA